jgi:hypothetical protein
MGRWSLSRLENYVQLVTIIIEMFLYVPVYTVWKGTKQGANSGLSVGSGIVIVMFLLIISIFKIF